MRARLAAARKQGQTERKVKPVDTRYVVDCSSSDEVNLCGDGKEDVLKYRKIDFKNVAATRMVGLDVSFNLVATVSDGLGFNTRLRRLNLAFNELAFVPDSVCALSNLTMLNLGHNRLTHLPEDLGSLQALTGLFVSHNCLVRLPKSSRRLHELLVVSCDRNPWNPREPSRASVIPEHTGCGEGSREAGQLVHEIHLEPWCDFFARWTDLEDEELPLQYYEEGGLGSDVDMVPGAPAVVACLPRVQ